MMLALMARGVAHPILYQDLAHQHPELFAVTNGERMSTTLLALTIVLYWLPSAVRCMLGRGRSDGDAYRAGCVPLALAVVLFNFRWFFALSELMQARMLLVAQGAMLTALLVAVYTHGRRVARVRMGRAIAGHLVALTTCIGISAYLR